jgi:ligand-binding sensor domain-containing protein
MVGAVKGCFGGTRGFVWRALAGLCLGLELWLVPAQATAAAADFVVEAWQTEAGLPHNAVTAVLQTRDGYLWLGTSNGLARFDGVRFATFRAVDHPGLRSNHILCLYEDRQGALWVGTAEGGLARFEKGEFTAFSISEGLSSETVLSIGEDRAGNLWVGTTSGLNRSSDNRAQVFFQTEALPDEPVYALRLPQRSPTIFATQKGVFRHRQERVVPYEAPGAQSPLTGAFYCVHEDGERRLWAGGEPGLVRLDSSGAASTIPRSQIRDAAVVALIEGTQGQIWFGTSVGEVYRVNPESGRLAEPAQASTAETGPLGERAPPATGESGVLGKAELVWAFPGAVTALHEDYEGNLWVGTTGSGVQRLKRRQLRWAPFPESIGETATPAIFQKPDGSVWLLDASHRLHRSEAGGLVADGRLPLPEGVVVQTVCAADPDTLWLGTRGDGLWSCSQGTIRQFSERDGLSDSQVTVLCADAQGGLWIGTRNGGLNYLSGQKVTRYNTPWGLGGAFACALEPGPAGKLWIGTTGDGLFELSEGRFQVFTQANGLSNGHVGALHADGSGTLWIGTAGGLCRLHQGAIKAFPSPNRLVEESIVQLHGDRAGHLWAGTSSGIYRYRVDQLNAYADSAASFVDLVPFGKEDGLPTIQCVPRNQSQGWPLRKGSFWFATTKGLVLEAPAGAVLNTAPPPVILEAMLIESESVALTDPVLVPPGKSSLQFQFTALSLTAPGKVAFCYRLEGFDEKWSEVTTSRTARYPRVPPGHYRFRVAARNNDGIWNETGASVALTVSPFWWESWWFRFVSVASGLAVLVAAYRLRLARRREIERLRLRIASDLHDDVGSSLWSITLLSRMLAQHGTLTPEERQDVNEINRISVQTSNSIRDIIWLINPAFNSLQDFVLRIKDSANVLLRGVDCQIRCEGIDPAQKLTPDFRQHLFFLLKEALTNVAKHAQATEVHVLLEQHDHSWRFVIRDNGVGFDPGAQTAGNGLKNLRARAVKIGAECRINSQPGQGTTITLTTARL